MKNAVDTFLPDENPIIADCKEKIVYRASMAGLRFFHDDIICTQESDGSQVVLLRRFYTGYQTEVTGDYILDENGDPIPDFQPTAWLEYPTPQLVGRKRGWCPSMSIVEAFAPRVVVRCPWLFFIVKEDGQVIYEDSVGFNI